jgi:hypothetical protein
MTGRLLRRGLLVLFRFRFRGPLEDGRNESSGATLNGAHIPARGNECDNGSKARKRSVNLPGQNSSGRHGVFRPERLAHSTCKALRQDILASRRPEAANPRTPVGENRLLFYLPGDELRVQRLDCHDADDVIGLRFIGAVNDAALCLVAEDRTGRAWPIAGSIEFRLHDGGAVQHHDGRLDLAHMRAGSPGRDMAEV